MRDHNFLFLKRIYVVFIILIILLVFVQFATQSANAILFTIDCEFEESVTISEVGPNQHGIIIYPGTLTCNMYGIGKNIQTVIIELHASTDQGWPSTVIPNQIIFEESGSESFNVTVYIPPATSYYTSGLLVVGGSITLFPGSVRYNIPPVTSTIKVNQYHGFTIRCQEPLQEIHPGEQTGFYIDINNMGNARDKFEINIINQEELETKGFKLELNPATISIPEAKNATVKLNITAPTNGEINQNHEIQINIFSVQAKLNENETIEENLTLIAYLTSNGAEDHDDLFGSLGLNEQGEIYNVDFVTLIFFIMVTIISILGLKKLIKAHSPNKK